MWGYLLGLFCFSVSVVDPGEGQGGAGLHGVTPLTEGFFTNWLSVPTNKL